MSNRPFMVTSCFTRNTPYERAAMRLDKSIDALRLPRHIEAYDCLGSWDKNCRYKAEFIREMLYTYPDNNIVFVDADAVILRYPILFDHIEVDFAAFYYDNVQLCSGTLFFQNNYDATRLVNRWLDKVRFDNNHQKKETDQQRLQEVIAKADDLAYLKLPPEYCKINDLMNYVQDPVIQHYQLSRTEKDKVGRKESI